MKCDDINQQFWEMSFREQSIWLIQSPLKSKEEDLVNDVGRKEVVHHINVTLSTVKVMMLRYVSCFLCTHLDTKAIRNCFVFSKAYHLVILLVQKTSEVGNHPAKKCWQKIIKLTENHINSHNPAISHYRRKHGPNRRYITSQSNATLMFNDFCEEHPEVNISYTFYCEQLKKMNISFSKKNASNVSNIQFIENGTDTTKV